MLYVRLRLKLRPRPRLKGLCLFKHYKFILYVQG